MGFRESRKAMSKTARGCFRPLRSGTSVWRSCHGLRLRLCERINSLIRSALAALLPVFRGRNERPLSADRSAND
jgi:hypothetical protein